MQVVIFHGKVSAPPRVSFFSWFVTLGKTLIINNLWKRGIVIVDCCFMCKRHGENVPRLFLHCVVAHELWPLILCVFGVVWVMPSSVMEQLTCWEGSSGKHVNGRIRKVVPLCIMWCL